MDEALEYSFPGTPFVFSLYSVPSLDDPLEDDEESARPLQSFPPQTVLLFKPMDAHCGAPHSSLLNGRGLAQPDLRSSGRLGVGGLLQYL